jgi:hypothetical protein
MSLSFHSFALYVTLRCTLRLKYLALVWVLLFVFFAEDREEYQSMLSMLLLRSLANERYISHKNKLLALQQYKTSKSPLGGDEDGGSVSPTCRVVQRGEWEDVIQKTDKIRDLCCIEAS